jgi:hypothetical protein
MTKAEEELESLRRAHQALRERAALERALFAEVVNRFAEGDVTPATLVRENAELRRQSAEHGYERDMAQQRVAELEAENQRHRLVLGTKLVSLALRVQRRLASLRGR